MITKATIIAGRRMQQLAIDRADYAGYAKLYKSRGDVSFSYKCLNHCKVIKARQRDWANRIIMDDVSFLALPKQK